MSLVNDALKKARMEAARGDAANRNVPYPALGRGEAGSSRAWIAAFGGLVLLAAFGGFFLFRAGKQSALRTETTIQAGLQSAAEPASPQQPEATTRGNGDALNGPGERVAPRIADSGTSDGAARTGSNENRTSPPIQDSKKGPSGTTTSADTAPPAARRTESRPPPSPETGPKPEQLRSARPAPAPAPSTTRERPATRTQEPSPKQAIEVLRSADIPGAGPVELGGIAWSGDRPFALLNGRVVRPGDSVAGLTVTEILANAVHLSGAAGDWILKLK